MKRSATWLGAAALTLIAPAFARAEPRIAIVVGNDAAAGRAPLRFAKADAQRVRDVLVSLGQVDDAHVLLDADAEALDDALEAVGRELKARGGQGTVLFYYSGHADDRALMMGATRYRFRDLRARLAGLPARLYVAMLDACESGAATRAKGGHAVPVVDLRIFDPTDTYRGGVFLTSSAAGELSHESDQLQASFFTHYLLAGLRGAADLSGDGRVSLEEAYRYAYQATVSRTQGSLHGTQHPTYDVDVAGRGQVILTWLDSRLAYLVLPRAMAGQLLVRSRGADGFIAEIEKAADRPVRLALSPGEYEVSTVKDGLFWTKTVQVAAQGTTVFDPSDMRSEPLAVLTRKGGPDGVSDVFRVAYQLRGGFLDDATPTHGVRATYLRHLGAVEIGVAAGWARSSYARADGIDVRLSQVGVALVTDLRWTLKPWLTLRTGAEVGADWVTQQGRLPTGVSLTRTAVTYPAALRLGAEVPLARGFSVFGMGRLGFVFFDQNGRLRWPLEAGLLAGMTVAL